MTAKTGIQIFEPSTVLSVSPIDFALTNAAILPKDARSSQNEQKLLLVTILALLVLPYPSPKPISAAGEPLTINAPLTLGDGYGISSASFTDNAAPTSYYLKPGATGVSLSVAGAVGIGTTAPGAPIEINQSSTGGLRLSRTSHDIMEFGLVGSNRLRFYNVTDDREDLVITNAGLIGIGTTAPEVALDVVGSINPQLLGISNQLTIATVTSGIPSIRLTNLGTNTILLRGDAGDSYINSGGQLGIGTTAPAYVLDVAGSIRAQTNLYVGTGGGYFSNDTGSRIKTVNDFYTANSNTYLYSDNLYLGNASGDAVQLRDNAFTWTGGTGGAIATSGNIGIGTAAPSQMLHILNSTSDASIYLQGANNSYSMGVDYSDSDKFKINAGATVGVSPDFVMDGAGDVAIGFAAPAYQLDVYANLSAPVVRIRSDGNAATADVLILQGHRRWWWWCQPDPVQRR